MKFEEITNIITSDTTMIVFDWKTKEYNKVHFGDKGLYNYYGIEVVGISAKDNNVIEIILSKYE